MCSVLMLEEGAFARYRQHDMFMTQVERFGGNSVRVFLSSISMLPSGIAD